MKQMQHIFQPEGLSTYLSPVSASPSLQEIMDFGQYKLANPTILAKPDDVPDSHIAYNPSSIYSLFTTTGVVDVMYARVEPDRANATRSHLGNSFCRPYIVNVCDPGQPLRPFYDAMEIRGEDPSLTRINRRLPSGKIEQVWLLSVVDPIPFADKPNEVESLHTRFYAGVDLNELEHIADGPPWMKDIPICQADGPLGTELDVYGRPQPISFSGNISHVSIPDLSYLSAEVIAQAEIIDESLAPVGGSTWIGAKDVINVGLNRRILPAHRAWRTGPDGMGRHYEAVFYGHNTQTGKIVDLGVLATVDAFSGPRTVKQDETVDVSDVVFTGGGYNGTLSHMTFGISDGSLAISGLVHHKI